MSSEARPFLRRLPEAGTAPLDFTVDGRACTGVQGDTVLTALLAAGVVPRRSDSSGEPRAGFCWIGACQDCWLWDAAGARVRACTTPLAAGLVLRTSPA
ncbi:MAG: (2Fe-2S)-binding protein [Rubrivivax sp.]|nr:(2Fe-2S)-binding protein [Rubrivivax sp.]